MRIALFEDDDDIRFLLEMKLKSAGHVVSAFENAFGFVDKVTEGRFDAVITDYQMPGPSGLDVCWYIGEIWKKPVPCLLHTASLPDDWPPEFTNGSLGENVTVSEKEIGFGHLDRFLKSLEL